MAKISNVQKGNKFEDDTKSVIEKLIKRGEIAISKKHYTLKKKPKYFNLGRGHFSEFDWSIEIRPKENKNIQLIYLIECKDFATSKVPASELEVLLGELSDGIKENSSSEYSLAYKLIFIYKDKIANTLLYKAKKASVMLIKVSDVEKKKYEIIHYRKLRNKENTSIYKFYGEGWKEDLELFLFNTVFKTRKKEFKSPVLSKKEINSLALNEFIKYLHFSNKLQIDHCITKTNLIKFLKKTYSLNVTYKSFSKFNNETVLGYFDNNKNTIYLSNKIKNTNRDLFSLCHEFAHFILHRQLKLDQYDYEYILNIGRSDFSIPNGKFKLDTPLDFIEWQANFFASVFILNESIFKFELEITQNNLGLSRKGIVIAEKNRHSIKDYASTLFRLSSKFYVSETVIEYRMSELKLLKKSF